MVLHVKRLPEAEQATDKYKQKMFDFVVTKHRIINICGDSDTDSYDMIVTSMFAFANYIYQKS